MKYIKYILISVLLLTLTGSNLVGQVPAEPTHSKLESRELDPRAKVLSQYFASHNSPFEYQAQDFIDASDKFGLDWKLVPAIAGVESTFGKAAFGYNAWGWGIYGDNALNFKSWRTGIYTVSKGLKTGYIDRGLTNPYKMNKVYAASPSWGFKVNFFMNDMDRFASQDGMASIKATNPLIKTAAASARLAYNRI